jgi:hypothetical protein
MLACQTATYALPGREQEARTNFDLLSNFNGGFDWKYWLGRAYKNEQYATQVLQPLGELERDLKITAETKGIRPVRLICVT